jgi:hypothetical protein
MDMAGLLVCMNFFVRGCLKQVDWGAKPGGIFSSGWVDTVVNLFCLNRSAQSASGLLPYKIEK